MKAAHVSILLSLMSALCAPALCAKEASTGQVEHMVVRLVKPEKYASAILPKEYWISNHNLTRVEEIAPPDAVHRQLILILVPDFWQIDVKTKEAQRIIGVKKDANFSIFGKGPNLPGAPKGVDAAALVQSLNFGHEMEFFKTNAAKKSSKKGADGVSINEYVIPLGKMSLSLDTKADSDIPRFVTLKYGEKEMTLKYDMYESIPFKKATFAVPGGLKVTKLTEADLNKQREQIKTQVMEQYKQFKKQHLPATSKPNGKDEKGASVPELEKLGLPKGKPAQPKP